MAIIKKSKPFWAAAKSSFGQILSNVGAPEAGNSSSAVATFFKVRAQDGICSVDNPCTEGRCSNVSQVYVSSEISCQAPCTFILPPFPLPTPTIIDWSPVTTALLVSNSGGVTTTTTTILVPEFSVSAIPFWPVTITSNQTIGVLSHVQNIIPPSIVVTLPGTVVPFPPATTNYTFVAEIQAAGQTVVSATMTSPATTTSSPTTTMSAVVTPSPIAANMASGCIEFYLVQSGNSCWSVETTYNIAAADFEAWNPAVGTGCASSVWLGYYYCISHGNPTSTSSGAGGQPTSTGTTSIPAVSVLDSISASIVNPRSNWDATRRAVFTITITPTSTTTSAQPTGTGFSIVEYILPYTNYEYGWLAIDYERLSAPIFINGSVSPGTNMTTTNSQTTFCDQISTFNQESSGDVLGSSDNGSEYNCTTVLNPATIVIAQETSIVPQWNCLTNVCT